jgi:uncharacterized protein (TIRG00374 family)
VRGGWWRLLGVVPLLGVAIALIWWRGPDWGVVQNAFAVVRWRWVIAAIALNLLSIVARSIAWDIAIRQALPRPRPAFPLVFSAFCVGLFANVVLPARAGELARVAVLARRLPRRRALWATLVGTVFAHRIFDLFPVLVLVVWVLSTAKIPHWALLSLQAFMAVGAILLAVALVAARTRRRSIDDLGRVRALLVRAREGLSVMRSPAHAALAIFFQSVGWTFQLLAVFAALRAFHIHLPLAAAGLVLVLMNVATVFPLWPGNIGLLQAAVALPLVSYGVAYARGFAFGIGLQAIEASVGVGVGLVFLAREGLSYATLKEVAGEPTETEDALAAQRGEPSSHARARMSG